MLPNINSPHRVCNLHPNYTAQKLSSSCTDDGCNETCNLHTPSASPVAFPQENSSHPAANAPTPSAAPTIPPRRTRFATASTDDALIRELLIPTRRLNVARLRRALRAERARRAVCGACGRAAWFVPQADRFFHADGSENRTCWLAYSRGEVP